FRLRGRLFFIPVLAGISHHFETDEEFDITRRSIIGHGAQHIEFVPRSDTLTNPFRDLCEPFPRLTYSFLPSCLGCPSCRPLRGTSVSCHSAEPYRLRWPRGRSR